VIFFLIAKSIEFALEKRNPKNTEISPIKRTLVLIHLYMAKYGNTDNK
jgi:hypothetical protein